MSVVVYRGEVAALQGQKFDVPETVPLNQRAKWIESQAREQEARDAAALAKAEADAERQAREAELLSARIEAAKSGEAFRTDLNALQAEVDEVKAQLETPDAEALLSMNSSVMQAFTTAKEVLERVDTAIAQAEQLQTSAVALLDEAQQARQASVQTIRNQQEAINALFSGYRDSLGDLEDQTNAAAAAVGLLNTAAEDNRETIATAANISEAAVNIASLEAKKATDEAMDEILSILSVALEALGVKEEDLALQMNADESTGKGIYLTREFLRRLKAIHSSKRDARDSRIEGPLL